ncbi:MAG: tetratricopeptide repeat protein [Acidobacteriota bacterium]
MRRLLGHYDDAEGILEELLLAHPNRSSLRARIVTELARVHQDQGKLESAESLAREVRAYYRLSLGEGSPQAILSTDLLADLLVAQGSLSDAMILQQEALDGLARIHGPKEAPLAPSLGRLAEIHARSGNWPTAAPLFEQARTLLSDPEARQPDTYARLLGRHAEALLARGRAEDADPLIREAYEVLLSAFGDGHPWVAEARSRLEKAQHL